MQLRNQKGFTLIEIAIVLTIVGLVIGGIWLAAATVLNNNKTAELSRQVIQIVQNTKGLFTNQTGANPTGGFNQAAAISAGVFPGGMVINGTNVRHPFATTLTTSSVTLERQGANAIDLTVGSTTAGLGLPQSACIDLVSRIATAENFSRYGLTKVGNINANSAQTMTMTKIQAVCPAATATNQVVITFAVP